MRGASPMLLSKNIFIFNDDFETRRHEEPEERTNITGY